MEPCRFPAHLFLPSKEQFAVIAAALCRANRSSAALSSAISPVSNVIAALDEAAPRDPGEGAHSHFETRIL